MFFYGANKYTLEQNLQTIFDYSSGQCGPTQICFDLGMSESTTNGFSVLLKWTAQYDK